MAALILLKTLFRSSVLQILIKYLIYFWKYFQISFHVILK